MESLAVRQPQGQYRLDVAHADDIIKRYSGL